MPKESSKPQSLEPGHPPLRSRRRVLRIGYGVILALLVIASFEAYQIQDLASSQHLDFYRHYIAQDEAMASLRYSVWLAGNRVRDFFIYTRADSPALLRKQLSELRADSDRALQRLDALKSVQNSDVRASIQEFWDTVQKVPETMRNATDAEQYAFIQEEIAPRRSTLYTALRELLLAEQANVQQLETEIGEARRNSARRLIVVLGLCVGLALAVARFSIAHSDNLERATEAHFKALDEAKHELEQLSGRLVDVEEEGRKRLARELHDEIGQALAVLQIEISNAQALPGNRLADMHARLAHARELAEKTVQAVRNMSLLLRPALLDDLGLIPALQWLLEDFMRRSGVACDFSTSGVDDRLPDPVRTCVYRVIQEAIHNCEKHSSASRVRISLRQQQATIVAEVEDNGRGFENGQPGRVPRKPGLGVVGMRERAARLGGTLLLESSPGHGTRLVLTIPAPAIAAIPEPARAEAAAEV